METVSEYVERKRQELNESLDAFYHHWVGQNKNFPNAYPEYVDDWDDQFSCFMEQQEED